MFQFTASIGPACFLPMVSHTDHVNVGRCTCFNSQLPMVKASFCKYQVNVDWCTCFNSQLPMVQRSSCQKFLIPIESMHGSSHSFQWLCSLSTNSSQYRFNSHYGAATRAPGPDQVNVGWCTCFNSQLPMGQRSSCQGSSYRSRKCRSVYMGKIHSFHQLSSLSTKISQSRLR